MKKKIFSVLMMVCLTCGLMVGCGNSQSDGESAKNDASQETASVVEKETSSEPEKETTDVTYSYPQVGEVENAALVEQEPDEELKFAFIGFANNSYWDLIYQGVDAATENLSEHNVKVEKINLGSDISADVINECLESIEGEYDGVVLTCFVAGCGNYIDAVVDAGAPVIIIGGDSADECERFAFIGQDNPEAGTTVAEYIDEKLGGESGAQFAVITSLFSMTNIEEKRNACIDYLEGKGYECVGSYEAADSAQTTKELTEQLIAANPDLKAIYCTAGGTYGAPQAVEEAGLTGDILVVGHDETAENLEYVRKGQLAVIGQNPTGYAYDAFIYLYNKVVADQDPAQEVMASASMIIDADNVDELFPE